MATKIRLQRQGKKGRPFYHIVIADGRAPRDGRYIERLGTYNPIVTPAEIKIDFDKALNWLQKGAQPSDTVRAILSYKGIMYKHHLLKGVKKGALTEEQAEAKFTAWLSEKEAKITQSAKDIELNKKEKKKKRIAEETKVNEARIKAISEKLAAETKKEEATEEEAKDTTEDTTEDTTPSSEQTTTEQKEEVKEEPKAEEKKEEVKEEPKAEEKKEEVKEEPKAEEKKEEVKEEPKAEVKEETKE